MKFTNLGSITDIRTGKLDVNAGSEDGQYPFFTCAAKPYKINDFAFDTEAVLIAGNGDLNVKYYQGKFNAYQRTYVIQNKDKTVLSMKYLYYFIETYMERLRRGAIGGIIKYIKLGHLTEAEIPLPPLNDQIRIAHLLGKVEWLIAQRKQHLQQLDDLLKSVFLEMFGDPIINPHKFPVRKLSEFYINPKDGTKCGPFGSALKKDEFVDSGIPVWNMDNIAPSAFMVLPFRMWITKEKFKELASYSVENGDIIISRAGTVGKMCVARTEGKPAIISTNLIRLRLGSELRPLHFVSLMTYCKGRVGRLKTGPDGSFTHMNTGILDKLEFPYPPTELQDQFAIIAQKVEVLKSRYQQSLDDLKSLYGTLSQKAFKGELDLSRLPLPESKDRTNKVADISADSMQALKSSERVISKLNKFNSQHTVFLKALNNMPALKIANSPVFKAARELSEQAALWRTPLDQFRNMSAVARAATTIATASNTPEVKNAALIAQQIANTIPTMDIAWLKDQQAIINAAVGPFSEMRHAIAALQLPDPERRLTESESVVSAMQAAVPPVNASLLALAIQQDDSENEPRYIFTRDDILQALFGDQPLPVIDLMSKLAEQEVVTPEGYSRIKTLLFSLLAEEQIQQQFNDEANTIEFRTRA
ncbi:restriction endonuclease subunit S [Rheinheimera soli]|uniref:Restriction endonuclease S subunit n=1 Tax=Rheinheimera soli TaxID=443616 RepID=A0ABU1VWQ3_9GAMM|nr:restriction endonuclease subunit S [Rheinheimera soli]MDR7120155.1 restriction endonuclease S subunit [Rheinheimera soli]